MERITITHLNGVYYTLYDCYGEIETSQDYNKIIEIYNSFKNDRYLQEEFYNSTYMKLRIEKDTYEDGRLIDSEVIAE